MTFFVERHNGERWTCLLAAEHYVGPRSISGPPEADGHGSGLFPPARTPGNASVFAGMPGWHARVRFNDQMMEIYDWAKIMENPADETSGFLWGWRLLERFPVDITADDISIGELSVV